MIPRRSSRLNPSLRDDIYTPTKPRRSPRLRDKLGPRTYVPHFSQVSHIDEQQRARTCSTAKLRFHNVASKRRPHLISQNCSPARLSHTQITVKHRIPLPSVLPIIGMQTDGPALEAEEDEEEDHVPLDADGLRTVKNCVECCFEEAHVCRFCLARYAEDKRSDGPPPLIDATLDQLILHLTEVHSVVWDMLRHDTTRKSKLSMAANYLPSNFIHMLAQSKDDCRKLARASRMNENLKTKNQLTYGTRLTRGYRHARWLLVGWAGSSTRSWRHPAADGGNRAAPTVGASPGSELVHRIQMSEMPDLWGKKPNSVSAHPDGSTPLVTPSYTEQDPAGRQLGVA
ncbi:hypothetical protein B0H11DRAFT_1915011 [Mycena galericulata]|nr:hypothetical protein B0H11DRAFT_1915011 [Mycena galericulata]